MAGPVVRRGRHGIRRADLGGERSPQLDAHVAGSSTTSPRTPAETHNLAAEHRDRLIEMIAHLVRRGRQVRRAARRRQRRRADGRREAADRRCRATAIVYYPGHAAVPFFAGPQRAQPPAQHHRRRGDPRRRRRGRAARAGHRGGRLSRSTSRTAELHYVHNWVGPRAHARRVRHGAAAPAITNCASSSSRPGSPTPPRATGSPGRLQLYIDGELIGDGRGPPTPRHSCSTPAR